MTASTRRPLSAIYLGGLSVDSSPISLSSPGSPLVGVKLPHLPSPPHTNNSASSGGSTEGTNFGSIRLSSTPATGGPSAGRTMLNGTGHQNGHNRYTGSDYGDDNEDDEDTTATLSNGSRGSGQSHSSLERVKSLADRNREVLNKLASISSGSRLGTPSPRAARTPLPSINTRSSLSTNTTPSSAASGSNRVSFTRSRSDYEPYTTSETDRHSYTSDQSTTPPASIRPSPAYPMPDLAAAVRERLISEPSPPRNRSSMAAPRNANNPTAPSRSRRVTMVEPNEAELAAAAAASSTASRRSPTATKRVRQPLPREFRDNRRSLDGALAPGNYSNGQQTGNYSNGQQMDRNTSDDRTSPAMYVGRGSPSPTAGASTFSPSNRQTRPRPGRSSIRHDRTTSTDSTGDYSQPSTPSKLEGRSSAAESPVKNKRFVLEGLRAAGLTTRREGDDPFGNLTARRANRLSGGLGARPSLVDRESSVEPEPVMSPRVGVGDERLPRTPPSASGTPRLASRSIQSVLSNPRPSTAAGGYDDNSGQHILRSYRSNLNLDRPLSAARNFTSPPATSRMSPMTPFMNLAGQGANDHGKLMLDSLAMFEGHLARLPASAHYGSTVGDLMRSAQVIVNTSHHLNNLLRNAGARALEEQVEAEVGDRDGGPQPVQADIWRAVGQDFRESLRASDEQVRSMTGFMLGVGRLLKETAAGTHGRGISLDESRLYSAAPDPLGGRRSADGRRSNDGRQSVEMRRGVDGMSHSSGGDNGRLSVELGRRSVEPGRRSVEGQVAFDRRDVRRSLDTPDSMRRIGASPDQSRPATSLSMVRDQDSRLSAQEMVERERRPSTFASRRYMPALSAKPTPLSTPITPATSNNALPPADSLDSIHARKPSVTSPEASHHRRALPPITIPPPLPTLPSESIIRRSASTRTPSTRKPKTPIASNAATVRGSSILPGAAGGNPTTAVSTTTVSTTADDGPDDSAVSPPNSKPPTFSRSRGSTLSALTGLQHHTDSFQTRKRTISATSAADDIDATPSPLYKTSPLPPKQPSPRPATLSRTSTVGSAARSSVSRPTEASAARSGSSARSRTVTAATASSLARTSGSGSVSGSNSNANSTSSERKMLRSSRTRMSLDGAQMTTSPSRENTDEDATPPTSAFLATERRPRKRTGGELYS